MFTGFGSKALPFLRALDFHQSREWYADNKALFESELRQPLVALVDTLTERCAAEGLPFRGAGKASTYRIYRDIRFSKDKRPFNRHVSALLTPSGTKDEAQCVLYVRIGLDGLLCATGWYQPSAERLLLFRRSIVDRPDRYRAVVASLEAKGLAFGETHALKRMPAGFEAVTEPDMRDALRFRTFAVVKPLEEARITTAGLVDDIVALASDTTPFRAWGEWVLTGVETPLA
jgi:uncharacterized protein (TIGR02453 family)